MRKVLFLDVDGVLNSKHTIGLSWRESLEEPLLELLVQIIEKTRAKVVLSSTWRLFPEPRKYLFDTFKRLSSNRRIKIEIVGETRELKHCDIKDRDGNVDVDAMAAKARAYEIKDFVERNSFKKKGVRWVVIDDMDLSVDASLKMRFVKTHPQYGLTAAQAVDAISKLNM